MPSLDHPVALVTGGSRGIGAAVSTQLAQRGCNLVINYHSKRSRAAEVAAAVSAFGQKALIAQADLTDSAAVTAMMEPKSTWWTKPCQ